LSPPQHVLFRIFLILTATCSLGHVDAVASTAEPSPESVIAEFPFQDSDESNRIMVDLALEGRKSFILMLDTGATNSVLTPLAARAAGVTVRRTKSNAYRKKTSLGVDLQFYVDTSSSDTGSSTGWEYGLLGGSFLKNYVVELDFDERLVRLLDPAVYQVPEAVDGPDETVLPVGVVSSRLVVPIQMNGKSLNVLLDTGAPSGLILSGKAATSLGVDVAALSTSGTAGTSVGSMELKFYETDSFEFAGFAFDEMPVEVAPRGWYNQTGNTDSVIGYDVLRHFKIRIDYANRRIWLRRVSTEITSNGDPYAPLGKVGTQVVRGDRGFYVGGVLPNSPAGDIGLQAGDLIQFETFEPAPSSAECLERIASRTPLRVRRVVNKHEFEEVFLPNASAYEAYLGPQRTMLKASAASRQAAKENERESRRAERLFVLANGGWQVVSQIKLRRGPENGEAWMSYEEMVQHKKDHPK
jgi:predicted aspartyl protease